MDNTTVFTKTAKGITQVNQRSASLSKDLMRILKLVDGKSTFAQIMGKAEVDKPVLEKSMNTLIKDGFARIFETRKDPDPFGEDDFDFTAPGKLPGATQRVIAAAALDIGELSRQQEKTEVDRKARENAQVVAREKAKQGAEARAAAEADAKAKAEAEMRAMEQARRAKDASERAKAELEVKMREEEARRKAVAEHQARLAAENKAKEEEESRSLAQLRAKAQAEADARARGELEAKVREEEARKRLVAQQVAKAVAEEKVKEELESQRMAELRAKAEGEARALDEARAEAETAARRHAQAAVASEQELKARLKEEIEARIRGEMETLLRDEIEEKARSEMQATIMAEARLAAKAELEERLQEERQALQKAEMEVRIQAEKAARERADQEAKLRAEAEARAVAESVAREKAEEENRRLRRMEARAREEAEAAAREKAETAAASVRERAEAASRLDAERKAKIEAEARVMVEAEERERREKELGGKIDAERKGREEAEKRARIEARARETVEETTREKVKAEIEGDMTRRAELEGKAQAKAYMQAKQQAELDEDDRLRTDQEKRAREIAEVLRTKVEPDAGEAAAPVKRRPRKKVNWVRNITVALGALLVIGVGLLHVIPLRGYADKLEKGIAAWLHEDRVSISSLKFSLIPSPHLKIEGFTVGKALDAKASHGRLFVDIPALLADRIVVNTLELDNVSITGDAPRRILSWGKVEGKKEAAEIEVVRLRGVKMDVKPEIKSFDVTLAFGRDGVFKNASLSGEGKWSGTIRPSAAGYDVSFNARNWDLPVGAPVPVSDVTAKGVLTANDITFSEFEADVLEGKVNGTLKVSWGPSVKLASDLSLARVRADQLMGAFTRDIAVTGKVEGNFAVSAESATLASLLDAPRVQGKFRLADGSISNADLVAAMQSADAAGRAGVTKFAELSGEFGTGDGRASYRNLILQGGVLRGSGGIDIAANGALSGRLLVEIRSNVAQDRGGFSVSGTVAKPILRRGG